jgi:hypothetical protein
MKLNWGHKILMAYSFFVLGIGVLAVKSSMQKFDLVQKDYYADELKYQNVIDASNRAHLTGGELTTEVSGGYLKIQLPDSFNNLLTKGTVHMYFAADEKKDLTKAFESSNAQVNMELLSNMKGNYTIKMDVEKGGVTYYFEKKIFL